MENATKALIMAGEILISLTVISIMVYVITTFGSFSANMNEEMATKETEVFNQHFWDFSGRINITADEIVGLINFAWERNSETELSFTEYATNNNKAQNADWVNIFIHNSTSDTINVFKDLLPQSGNITNNIDVARKQLKDFLEKYNTEYYYCNVNNISISSKTIKATVATNSPDILLGASKRVYQIDFHKLSGYNSSFSKFNMKENNLNDYKIEMN